MDYLQQIAERVRGLRDALELSVDDMAAQCGVTAALLEEYESGGRDIPVSFLHRLCLQYGVEMTALLSGTDPTMHSYFVTRAGKGPKVERTGAYSYLDLASGFRNRDLFPFLVTVEPSDQPGPLALNCHDGQEMDYVLEGCLQLTIGNREITLNAGDTVMFDARQPHGMKAVGDKPVTMLAIIS